MVFSSFCPFLSICGNLLFLLIRHSSSTQVDFLKANEVLVLLRSLFDIILMPHELNIISVPVLQLGKHSNSLNLVWFGFLDQFVSRFFGKFGSFFQIDIDLTIIKLFVSHWAFSERDSILVSFRRIFLECLIIHEFQPTTIPKMFLFYCFSVTNCAKKQANNY